MLGAGARLTLGLAVGLAAMAGEASAQDRSLTVGLKARVEHDSNVLAGRNVYGQGKGAEDTSFSPEATIDLTQPLGRHSAYLRGGVGYTFYNQNADMNRERLNLSGGTNLSLRACAVSGNVSYGRGVNTFEDPAFVYDARSIRSTLAVTGGVNCSTPTGIGVMAQVAKNWSDNSRSSMRDANYESLSYTGGLTYARPALGTLTLFGSREEVEYPDRVVGGGFTVDSFGGKYDRQLGARIQGTVTVSHSHVEQDPLFVPGFGALQSEQNELSYGGTLTFRVNSRLNLLASFNRGITPAIGFQQAYEVSNRYRVSGTYKISSRLTAAAGLSRIERDPGEDVLPLSLLPTESTLDLATATDRYQQNERIGIEVYYEHEARDTNISAFDYSADRIGVTTVVTF